MSEAVIDDIVAVLPPLLNALEALGFFQRHLHPPAFASVMNAIGTPDEALQTAHTAIGDWLAESPIVNLGLPLATVITGTALAAVLILWPGGRPRAVLAEDYCPAPSGSA